MDNAVGPLGYCVYISGNSLLPVLQLGLFPLVLKQYFLVVYQNISVAN